MMTYDFHGAWDKQTGHNSPLFAAVGDSSQSISIPSNLYISTNRRHSRAKVVRLKESWAMSENKSDFDHPPIEIKTLVPAWWAKSTREVFG